VLDRTSELGRLVLEPGCVGGAGPAGHHVEQPGVQATVLVAGQVDHRGHRPIRADPGRPPDVFIHAECGHTAQPYWVRGAADRFDPDGVPQCVPVHSQVPGQSRHRGVVEGQRVGGPRDRPAGELGPRRDQLMLFAERDHRTSRLGAPPEPLTPAHSGDCAKARRVGSDVISAAVTDRDHSTARAATSIGIGLNGHHKPVTIVAFHTQHMHPGHVEQGIGPSAPARARTTRTVVHVGVFISSGSLVAPDHEGPDTLIPVPPRRPHHVLRLSS
jgi:hypothetical protein